MGVLKFSQKFKLRPVKSAGRRRQRVKAQKKRLLAAGMDPKVVERFNVHETRQALKTAGKKAIASKR